MVSLAAVISGVSIIFSGKSALVAVSCYFTRREDDSFLL